MSLEIVALLSAFALVALGYVWRWFTIERRRRREQVAGAGTPSPQSPTASRPRITDPLIGFVTNFFDTLGIGSFAPTTAIFKLLRRMPDEQIPGTLNAGHALP